VAKLLRVVAIERQPLSSTPGYDAREFDFLLKGVPVVKKLFLTAAALATFSTAALAADLPARTYTKAPVMPVAAIYDWTGFYIGGHVGGAWADSQATELDPGTGAFPTGTVFAKTHLSGFLGGVQAGYNWQIPSNIVLGIEGEFSWADVSGTATTVSTVPRLLGFQSTTTVKESDYATVAGRLGYAINNWLIYGKGGAAWTRTGATGVQLFANGAQSSTSLVATDWRDGWVVGVGAEWGFAPNWSAKIEYNHFDFGNHNEVVALNTGTTSNVRSALTVDMVKGGVNYRFNWGAPLVAKY
jgi:outer membrane immunogenic protein